MIISKFRNMYILKLILGFGLALIIMFVCLIESFENGSLNYSGTPFIIGLLVFIFFVLGLYELFILSEIRLTENSIQNETIVFGKKTTIPISEIKSIKFDIERSQSEVGNISDGYPTSTIYFKNGSRMIISSDCYSNYGEIIKNIKYSFYSKHEA
jgi:hypothetical protein